MTDAPNIGDGPTKLGRACRHFDGRAALLSDGQCCKIGHNISKIVTTANGGSDFRTAYMYPCRPGPERKADCPDYDPKTDSEIAASKAAMCAQMDRLVKAMPLLNGLRATMVKGRIVHQVVDCPFCGATRALHVTCAVDHNNHMSARCAECREGFIE
ncbi:hypothetical protein [Pseudogemmobacter sonorensis]|uniref:hypothetical protein n=1 Tax=Pseudogemmobacter sonorensis TaxID=2989681 RepID=UPI0036888385